MMRGNFLKVVGAISIVTAFLVGGLIVGWGKSYGQVKPILVGAPVPRASAYGQNGERGMILAAEEINAAGGIKLGKTVHPLKLEIIDTRDEEPGVPTSEVLLALEKLILQKKSDVIVGGPVMSECGLAAMDLYSKYKVVDIVSIGCYTPGWIKRWPRTSQNTNILSEKAGAWPGILKKGLICFIRLKKSSASQRCLFPLMIAQCAAGHQRS